MGFRLKGIPAFAGMTNNEYRVGLISAARDQHLFDDQ
jgi:hypothetical protein